MKNLFFALCGMFIMMFVFVSCFQEPGMEAAEDETEAVEETPVTKEGNHSNDDELEPKPSQFPQDEKKADVPVNDSQADDPPDEKSPVDDQPDKESTDDNFEIPSILINELRTEYQGKSSKVEFIEFKMLSQGNLKGVKVFIASNTKNPLIYEFLPVDVKEGEYVVLHLRTMSETCISEYGEDLNESSAIGSCADVRDFWVPGNNEYLRKTDAVYIKNINGDILDAVIFTEDTNPSKPAAFFNSVFEYLISNNAWKTVSESISAYENAVYSYDIKSSMTRSISRDETACDTDTKTDWYITATGGYTPGKENNPARY